MFTRKEHDILKESRLNQDECCQKGEQSKTHIHLHHDQHHKGHCCGNHNHQHHNNGGCQRKDEQE